MRLNTMLDSRTFRSFYYLKEELVAFCRENKLPVTGGKIELTDRIAYYLDTGKVLESSSPKKKNNIAGPITEDSVIEENIVCSEKHRVFFIEKIGKSFSFNVMFQKWLKSNAFFEDNKDRSLSEAIICWKYKKSLRGHNCYERSDLNALKQNS